MKQQVIDQIVAEVEKNNEGKVDYHNFITALRFNGLPNKPYNNKFKHRIAPNPDMPCGHPKIRWAPPSSASDVHKSDVHHSQGIVLAVSAIFSAHFSRSDRCAKVIISALHSDTE